MVVQRVIIEFMVVHLNKVAGHCDGIVAYSVPTNEMIDYAGEVWMHQLLVRTLSCGMRRTSDGRRTENISAFLHFKFTES